MKRARAYRRGPRFFMHAVSRTPAGTWVMAGPVVVAEVSEAETFLGEALADTLAASRSGARDAGESIRKQILERARTKSWTTFLRGTLVCDVEKDEVAIRFFPARSGFHRPFAPSRPPASTLPTDALPIDLGAAIRRAFKAIEPRCKAPKRAT